MVRKYPYFNKWSNFVFIAMICALCEVIVCIVLANVVLTENFMVISIFVSLNIASMIFTALLMLAYIHYKSPHYEIIFDKEMIIIPKYAIIPDSYFIHYKDIIYFGEIFDHKKSHYKIVYNGGSVILKKNYLKNPDDIDEIIYFLKEVAL